jgi:CheY-like chemotaxis protein
MSVETRPKGRWLLSIAPGRFGSKFGTDLIEEAMEKIRPPRPCLLVVEDDPNVSAPLAELAAQAGFRTLLAANGREALDILEQETEQPDLMLVDLFMPVMNGVELLRAIKASPKWANIPRVIMTGTNDPMIRVREDSLVLYKPVDFESFSAVLKKYGNDAGATAEEGRGGALRRAAGRLNAFRRGLNGHPLLLACLFTAALAAATVVATVRARGPVSEMY